MTNAATPPTNVSIPLVDRSRRELSRADLEAATAHIRPAQTDAPGVASEGRVTVRVNSENYEAVSLVARALDVASDQLRLGTTVRALRALELPVESGFRDGARRAKHPTLSDHTEPADVADTDDAWTPPSSDLTAASAQQLQRHRGQWAALRAGVIVATATNLAELLGSLETRDVTITHVPLAEDDDRA